MKKINLICMIFCALVIFSCKKDKTKNEPNPNPGTGGLHVLSFKVSGFTQSIGPIDANSHLKTNAIVATTSPKLLYRLFDSNSKTIKSRVILPTDPDYSNFKDTVAPGSYTAFFAAGYGNNFGFNDGGYNDVNNVGYFKLSDLYTPNPVLWDDFFDQKVAITVGNQDITQNVTLQRKVAKLQLNIQDAIPATVKSISMSFTESKLAYSIIDDAFAIFRIEHFFPATLVNVGTMDNLVPGSSNNNVSVLTTNLGSFSVTINCKNAAGDIILQKFVTTTCQANKITLISGKLFGTSGPNALVVTTNNAWNPDTPPIHF